MDFEELKTSFRNHNLVLSQKIQHYKIRNRA